MCQTTTEIGLARTNTSRFTMEPKAIFDVATKPFDWQPIVVSAALFSGGLLALIGEKFRLGQTAIKSAGYFLIALGIGTACYVSIGWQVARRECIKVIASGHYGVVQGTVEDFMPMYYDGRRKESFRISDHTFRYSDNRTSTCFNQPWAHGGPIRAGLSIKISFVGSCILRIEAVPGPPHTQN